MEKPIITAIDWTIMTTAYGRKAQEKNVEQLTAQQAKMVIEYFAAQAAEDAPEYNADKHWWMTRMQASLAVGKQITEHDWNELVDAMTSWQSFDRDPDGYLHQNGYRANHIERSYMRDNLQDEVSWRIDKAYDNAGE